MDSRNTDVKAVLHFAEQVAQIAPCYYVSGNHEVRISEYAELKTGLEAAGITVLENESIELVAFGEQIMLLGIDDPSFTTDYIFRDTASVTDSLLESLTPEDEPYTILLAHRPEFFDVYVKHDMDLILSGHTHGGQIRLPVIGGLVAPNQGLFPKYDSGCYTQSNTNMVVSRGLGNSIVPIRFNNQPEIILIELTHK